MPDPTRIVRVEPSRLEEAMSALLGAGPAAAARFVEQARASRVALEHLWCSIDTHGRYRAAVLAVPSPGRASMLLATRAQNGDDARQLGPLIATAIAGSATFADIAQALVEPARVHDITAFEAGGLTRMADLEYLERGLPRAGILEPPPLPSGWTIESAGTAVQLAGNDVEAIPAGMREELIEALEQTYLDTLDCPGLAGMRATKDVLVGHFGTGTRPRHWLVARQPWPSEVADSRPVPSPRHDTAEVDALPRRVPQMEGRRGPVRGVCLLNVTPDGSSAELVYLGLAPAARGHGIAQALLAHGLHACSRSRCTSVSLAVDARNVFARRLYERNGFRRVSTRVALVCKTHDATHAR